MRTLRAVLLVGLSTLLLLSGCKTPRPTHEAAVGDLSGEWSARSVATTWPEHAGEILWRLILDEGHGGRFEGRGSLARAGTSSSFTLSGVRGESVISFDLRMEDGEGAKFDGSIMDATTIVGRMMLREDTVPVTFTRP